MPHQAPILSSCCSSHYLKSPPRSRNSFQTVLLALLESLIECYKLETLNFNPSSYYSSKSYGNPTCNLPIGKSPSCNSSIKAMTKTKLTLPPTGARRAHLGKAFWGSAPCPTWNTHWGRQHSHLQPTWHQASHPDTWRYSLSHFQHSIQQVYVKLFIISMIFGKFVHQVAFIRHGLVVSSITFRSSFE